MNNKTKIKNLKNSSNYLLKSYKFLSKEYNNEDILIIGESKDCSVMKTMLEKISCRKEFQSVKSRNILVLKKNFNESLELINQGKKFGLVLFDIESKENLKIKLEKIKILRSSFDQTILLTANYNLLEKIKSNCGIFVQTNGVLIKHTSSFGQNLARILEEVIKT